MRQIFRTHTYTIISNLYFQMFLFPQRNMHDYLPSFFAVLYGIGNNIPDHLLHFTGIHKHESIFWYCRSKRYTDTLRFGKRLIQGKLRPEKSVDPGPCYIE